MTPWLRDARSEIDAIDAVLVAVLVRRRSIVAMIAARKARERIPARDPRREEVVARRLGPALGRAVLDFCRPSKRA